MSLNILFIHGINVRQGAYQKSIQGLRRSVLAKLPQTQVHDCYWGDLGGKLNLNGKSVPTFAQTLSLAEEDEDLDPDVKRWQQLYQDALIELKLYSLQTSSESGSGAMFSDSPAEELRKQLESLYPENLAEGLAEKLKGAELDDVFEAARREVNQSQALEDAVQAAGDDVATLRWLVARAVIARAVQLASDDGVYPLAATHADVRDELVRDLANQLAPEMMGLVTDLFKATILPDLLYGGAVLGTWVLTRKRGNLTTMLHQAVGDVLVYQAYGQRIRERILSRLHAIGKPCVIIAHSLGGIAAVELLIETPEGVDVPLLITHGSQSPFFYELNALQTLELDQPLPEHFPKWLNFYDLNDVLSYVAAPVFGETKVTDIEVNSRQPFPMSHSAYFSQSEYWETVVPELNKLL